MAHTAQCQRREELPGKKNLADTAAPLTSLLKKTAKWQWQDEQERAFQKLKDDLATSTTLAHPDTTQPFILHLDASGDAVGATLLQLLTAPVEN